MSRTALALITASILSLAACGGDDTSSTAGGSGTGGTGGGSGGSSGTGGGAGTSGTGGSSGGGQAGTTPVDASTGTDARADTPTGTPDAPIDRGSTIDAPAPDGGSPGDVAPDTTPTPDAPPADTSSPPDSGQPDTAPPTDGSTGDATSDTPRDAPVGDGSSTMVLTSTGFTEGAMIPSDFTCAGTNVSPPLQWTAGPPNTMSYAVVLTDRTVGAVLTHSILYDIPANVTSLPMNVEKVANPSTPAGAKQVRAYDGMTYGYMGPCPSGALHNYEFSVHAIDVAMLPGVTTTSMRPAVDPVIAMHTVAIGLLNGQSNAKK